MKKIVFGLLLVLLVACSPSEAGIQTAIAETQAAQPTATPAPTATPTPCVTDELHEQITTVQTRFSDTVSLATNTPRMQLADLIAEMQAIRRDTENLSVPGCLAQTFPLLIAYMDATIEGFTAFLAEFPNLSMLRAGRENKEQFVFMYAAIRKEDGLKTGRLQPLTQTAITVVVLPGNNDHAYFEFQNTLADEIWYVTVQFEFTTEDGTVLNVAQQVIETIAPGEKVALTVSRDEEMIVQGVHMDALTVKIIEAFTGDYE